MKNLSLIANTGIQFYKFTIDINPNEDVIKQMGFYEFINESKGEISLQYAYKIPNTDIWASKKQLVDEDYLDEDNKFIGDVNLNTIIPLNSKDKLPPEYFTVNDIQTTLDQYENRWLPIPYFKQTKNKKNIFGPISWSRMYLKKLNTENYKKGIFKYEVILAFDTKIDEKISERYTPRYEDTNEGNNMFSFCSNEDHNLNFCNADFNCNWVEEYLRKVVYNGVLPANFPTLKYLAEYLYLLKYLSELEKFYTIQKRDLELKLKNVGNPEKKEELIKQIDEVDLQIHEGIFPTVFFQSDKHVAVDVDLVLDIGNSNTCALLFESPMDITKNFNFNSVKKLELSDLSEIGNFYNDAFSMRLVFAKPQFGEIDIPEYQNCFKWPSLVRVGKEAERLLNLYNIDIHKGSETATNNSSPKRYLWDNKKSRIPWEFVNINSGENGFDSDYQLPTNAILTNEQAYYEGVSEQFSGNGKYTFVPNSSVEPYFSRKSLMTFVFMEIFLQALRQINSHDFREKNDGELNKPRRLRRVTITSPTALVQKEQVQLRTCAVEAAQTLKRFFTGTYNQNVNPEELKIDFKIIPDPDELKKDLTLTRAGEKKDWIYDEATCNQLVFLYAEISQRYLNNAAAFFELYGKKRNDVEEFYQKSITIGTIDIGGGTTDLMIAAYEYASDQSNAVIKPKPLFWESFTLAGDDLLKEIVRQIVLEGDIEKEEDLGCKGVIKNYAFEQKCVNIAEKMQNFFGTDVSQQDYIQRIFRKNFNVQISVPIALKYVEHASGTDDDKELSFEDIFSDNPPNSELIKYINNHFGGSFKFENIKWKLSKRRVYEIIESTFDSLFKQTSILMSSFGCDFVLLSGKPTLIPKIREMFIKYYPVSPDRIISLNKYRIGRWFPSFGKVPDKADLGYIKEPKTIVAVGAIIALMGGKLDMLGEFKINTDLLIKNLTSTTDYIGAVDSATKDVKIIYLSPEENKNLIDISGLPVILGYKQLPSTRYPSRPIYKLEFNESYLRKRVMQKNSHLDTEIEIQDEMKEEKAKILRNMPLKVKISRQFRQNKEEIEITSVTDRNRDDLSENILSLNLMTLPDETGYWLDTGSFILDIKK